ncbi:MAG: hypothetical protein HC830_09260 [Bacteroidetes bacterium]|nr:hypothetical protein [Bacteroidota bacterium]
MVNFSEIETQLEDAARFIPSVNAEILSEEASDKSTFDTILEELQKDTMFKPSFEIENEFTDVLKELSESAKFSPSANL